MSETTDIVMCIKCGGWGYIEELTTKKYTIPYDIEVTDAVKKECKTCHGHGRLKRVTILKPLWEQRCATSKNTRSTPTK